MRDRSNSREAPTRLTPRSYFWTCWKVRPSASPSRSCDMPINVRRSRMRAPTCTSTGLARLLLGSAMHPSPSTSGPAMWRGQKRATGSSLTATTRNCQRIHVSLDCSILDVFRSFALWLRFPTTRKPAPQAARARQAGIPSPRRENGVRRARPGRATTISACTSGLQPAQLAPARVEGGGDAGVGGADQRQALLHRAEAGGRQMLPRAGGVAEPGIVGDVDQPVGPVRLVHQLRRDRSPRSRSVRRTAARPARARSWDRCRTQGAPGTICTENGTQLGGEFAERHQVPLVVDARDRVRTGQREHAVVRLACRHRGGCCRPARPWPAEPPARSPRVRLRRGRASRGWPFPAKPRRSAGPARPPGPPHALRASGPDSGRTPLRRDRAVPFVGPAARCPAPARHSRPVRPGPVRPGGTAERRPAGQGQPAPAAIARHQRRRGRQQHRQQGHAGHADPGGRLDHHVARPARDGPDAAPGVPRETRCR